MSKTNSHIYIYADSHGNIHLFCQRGIDDANKWHNDSNLLFVICDILDISTFRNLIVYGSMPSYAIINMISDQRQSQVAIVAWTFRDSVVQIRFADSPNNKTKRTTNELANKSNILF